MKRRRLWRHASLNDGFDDYFDENDSRILENAKNGASIRWNKYRSTRHRVILFVSFVLGLCCCLARLNCSPEVYLQSALAERKQESFHNATSGSDSSTVAVFHHIFIPTSPLSCIVKALEIVNEQVLQLALSATTSSRNVVMYYMTIGTKNVLRMPQLCEKYGLDCRSLGHKFIGFEELTLQSLYGYCKEHHDTTVVYMHTKGSYHSQRGENDIWRRYLTQAALEDSCMLKPSSECSVCGLLFQPLWTMFFPGNIWTAKCSYVQQLLPPTIFREEMTRLVHEMMQHQPPWQVSLFPTHTSGYLGIDRYASEHWIASHPSLIPCDRSKRADLEFWWKGTATTTFDSRAVVSTQSHDT
jgi:hypothetical protein